MYEAIWAGSSQAHGLAGSHGVGGSHGPGGPLCSHFPLGIKLRDSEHLRETMEQSISATTEQTLNYPK